MILLMRLILYRVAFGVQMIKCKKYSLVEIILKKNASFYGRMHGTKGYQMHHPIS